MDGNAYNELECVARANYEANNQSDALGLLILSGRTGMSSVCQVTGSADSCRD